MSRVVGGWFAVWFGLFVVVRILLLWFVVYLDDASVVIVDGWVGRRFSIRSHSCLVCKRGEEVEGGVLC